MALQTGTAIKPLPPQLPDNIDGWTRKLKAERTLNDQVEDVHRILVDDESYLKLLYAVYDEQAVEGSLSADNIMAAEMIRDKAKKMGAEELAGEKLATISKALGVVLRRYGSSRKERRHTVGGQTVPGDNGD